MNVIDTLPVDHPATDPRTLVLCSGDIASIPANIGLQYLVISAFADSYAPEHNPYAAELERLGVDLAALERNYRLHDFRPSMPCWVTSALNVPDVHFQHLLVWEPAVALETNHRLNEIQYAFQALSRLEGYTGGRSAVIALWPSVGDEVPADIFRMQFFAAMALAARMPWQTLYLMVPPDHEAIAREWWAALKVVYQDPPIHLPEPVPPPSPVPLPNVLSQLDNVNGSTGTLTDRQAAALCAYTTMSYRDTNRALRYNDPRHPEFVSMQPLIEAIASALSHLPNVTGTWVNRRLDPFEGIEELYQDGQAARELAFTSTSFRDLGFGDWRIRTLGALGKHVKAYSMNPNEEEVLFDSAMTHVVTDVTYIDEEESHITSFERIPGAVGVRETHL
jgi:hypothetical protein